MPQKKLRIGCILGIFLGAMWVSWYEQLVSSINWKTTDTGTAYHRFDEVLWILQNLYYDQDKIQTGVMIQNAVKAYVDALNDPYTVYMDAETNSWFQEDLKGESDFEGIGAVISKKDYYILVEEVIKESPAFKAGIMPLDRIVIIGTGSVKDLTVKEAVSQIRWPKWTKILLTIERIKKDGSKELIQQEVTRDKLSVPSVTSRIISTGNKQMWYINISVIGEETENLLKAQIQSLKANKINGIILDLRGNWWGFLPIAVEIASHFIPKNKLVVTAKYKKMGEETFYSKGYSDLENIPTVVLMDEMTASAWEIIALALQEQIWTKLIGTQSFGKGSIQTMDDFKDGDSLKYTIGKRYSPSGKNIDKVGITPDVPETLDIESYKKSGKDSQLDKATEILQNL